MADGLGSCSFQVDPSDLQNSPTFLYGAKGTGIDQNGFQIRAWYFLVIGEHRESLLRHSQNILICE